MKAVRHICAAFALAVALAAPCGAAFAADDALPDEQLDNTINEQQVPDSSFLYDTSIYDLNNAELSSDDRVVQVTGEVVGDLLYAEEDEGKRWITLSSSSGVREGSISVLIDESDVDMIDTFGGYGATGTELRVQGVFHISCEAHEGIEDIHATQVDVSLRGQTDARPADLTHFVPGIVLCIAGIAMAVLYRFLRERER